MDFSETIVVCDIKVGRCRQLNEYTNLCKFQGSMSVTDLGPRSLRFNIFEFFFLETFRLIKVNFYVEPPWDGE